MMRKIEKLKAKENKINSPSTPVMESQQVMETVVEAMSKKIMLRISQKWKNKQTIRLKC